MTAADIGVIGGTGFYSFIQDAEEHAEAHRGVVRVENVPGEGAPGPVGCRFLVTLPT